mgnify:CR=1 FL=1
MSIFKKLFGPKEIAPIDLNVLKVDMHSHLIPGIDDGAPDVETAVNLVKRFIEMGYEKIVTTPHIMSDHYKNTPETISNGLEALRAGLKEAGIKIPIEAAAEYYLDDSFMELLDDKENDLLSIGRNKYLLFELSMLEEPRELSDAIFKMSLRGYKPVLAHPERYGYMVKDFKKLEDVKNRGADLQVNLMSLVGHYSPEVKKTAEKLIDAGMVDFIGTDCHNMRHTRVLEECRKSVYLKKLIDSGNLKNTWLLK